MARKKKEEIKEEAKEESVAASEAAVALSESAPNEKTEPTKKTVKRGRTASKTAQKKETKPQINEETKQETKEEEVKPEPSVAPAEESKEVKTAEEKSETKPQKPKRVRKPAVKKITDETKAETPAEATPEQAVKPEPKTETKKTATRAEKNETIKSLVKELLTSRPYKWSELLDEGMKLYQQRIEEKDGHVANDVRGRIGSVFDVMKKDGEVVFDGGMYALKQPSDKKADEKPANLAVEPKTAVETKEETPVKEETSIPAPVETKSEQPVEVKAEKQLPVVKQKAEIAPVFDMTLLLGNQNKTEKEEKSAEPKKETAPQIKAEERPVQIPQKPTKTEAPREPKQRETKTEKKVELKKPSVRDEKKSVRVVERRSARTAENRLKENFLKKIRSLGGKYFEYYSIYLLERYSLRNGRRVDGFKVSGGENDGGIDGEIEVTDRIGFKETIYVQAKNWKPIYGKEDSWVIGETALREFIGAVAYRQAKEGKQRCRGIFITTSYFTAGSKEILEKMSDQFVGYDGDDLFEAAKECSFGLIEKDGEWQLDENLFVGDKAFFNLY